MKFKVDENLPSELAVDLRGLGHEADTVFDIANLQQYPPKEHAGVVLFRPARSGRRTVLAFVRDRLAGLLDLDLEGRVTVVGPD